MDAEKVVTAGEQLAYASAAADTHEKAGVKTRATEEQLRYAKVLSYGMKVGLLGIVATMVIYMLGILPAKIPVGEVSNYWGMSVHECLKATGCSPGWAWVNMLGYGDFINFLPIAVLAGITVVCYISIIPILLRKKDKVYVAIAIMEVLVLALAASGVISTGGH